MGHFLSLNTILQIVEELKKQGKTIVTTNGCFDILHAGHLDYLTKTSQCGDILIVGINTDKSVQRIKGPSRPINNEIDRAVLISALQCVDYTFLFDEETPDTFLTKLSPDVHVKGNDYSIDTLPEAKTVLKLGAELKFVSLSPGKSTTNVIDKILSIESRNNEV